MKGEKRMKISKKLISLIMALAMIASLAACGSSDANSSSPADTNAPSANESNPASPAAPANVPKFMTVGTGATGGAYYPIGVALADIMTSSLGTQATAEVTGGSLDNLQLINEGTCDIGIVQGNNMMDA